MLELLRGKNLCNVIVIVTRYFGGILISTRRDCRAYAGATKLALEEVNFIEKQEGKKVEIVLEYGQLENFKYYCRKEQIKIEKVLLDRYNKIVKEEYSDNVIIFIELSNKKLEKMKKEIDNLTLKILRINKMEEKYI